MTTNTIHVALASDNNYFEGLLTTMWSIARNCSRPSSLVFHVLDGGIPDDSFAYLKERIIHFGSTVDRITIDQQRNFGSFRTYHGNGRMTYARLLLPDLLPNVDQIVYTDVDIVWIADIAELWDTLDHNAIIHCTPSNHTIKAELDWFAAHNLKFEYGKRFCAGMIVMNLAKFRKESLHTKMLDTISACNGNVPCVDETVLNAFTFWRNDRAYLDPRWQYMSYGKTMPLDANGFVLHFGTDAPWKTIHAYHHLLTNQHFIWHGLHAEAREITTWQSLRLCNGILDIIACRVLFLAASKTRLGYVLLKFLLWLRNKSQALSYMDLYLRKFEIPQNFRWEFMPQSAKPYFTRTAGAANSRDSEENT